MDPTSRLRQEFLARERTALRGNYLGRARESLTATLMGALAAALVIGLMVTVTGVKIYWHSFLTEILLAGFMGLVLARIGGGLLKGALLLPLAYGGAYLLRQHGVDPAQWIAPETTPAIVEAIGHLVVVSGLVAFGGIIGYIVESRSA